MRRDRDASVTVEYLRLLLLLLLLARSRRFDDDIVPEQFHPVNDRTAISTAQKNEYEERTGDRPQLGSDHLLLHLLAFVERALERFPSWVLLVRDEGPLRRIDPRFQVAPLDQFDHFGFERRVRLRLVDPERGRHARERDGREGLEVGEEGALADQAQEGSDVRRDVNVEQWSVLCMPDRSVSIVHSSRQHRRNQPRSARATPNRV